MINEEKTIPMHRIEQRIYVAVLRRNRARDERGVSFSLREERERERLSDAR
jgi:hypothetical protein